MYPHANTGARQFSCVNIAPLGKPVKIKITRVKHTRIDTDMVSKLIVLFTNSLKQNSVG